LFQHIGRGIEEVAAVVDDEDARLVAARSTVILPGSRAEVLRALKPAGLSG
jgi:hypothetical protein